MWKSGSHSQYDSKSLWSALGHVIWYAFSYLDSFNYASSGLTYHLRIFSACQNLRSKIFFVPFSRVLKFCIKWNFFKSLFALIFCFSQSECNWNIKLCLFWREGGRRNVMLLNHLISPWELQNLLPCDFKAFLKFTGIFGKCRMCFGFIMKYG